MSYADIYKSVLDSRSKEQIIKAHKIQERNKRANSQHERMCEKLGFNTRHLEETKCLKFVDNLIIKMSNDNS